MTASILIRHSCPQCGGALELPEASRILSCPYCGVRLIMTRRGIPRYVMPHRIPDEIPGRERFFIPYLRFRGPVLYCHGYHIRHKFLELSRIGLELTGLPPSLGYRPQALPLVPAEILLERQGLNDADSGTFLGLKIKTSQLLRQAARIPKGSQDMPVFHQTFIGENISIIYLPVFRRGSMLFDGVTRQPLAAKMDEDQACRFREESATFTGISFVPALCPECGWDLAADDFSMVFHCPGCGLFWSKMQPGAMKLSRIPVESIGSQAHTDRLLPFWRFQIEFEEVRTLYDLFRFLGLPEGFGPAGNTLLRPAAVLVPAFSTSPKGYLNLSRSITASQHRIEPELPDNGLISSTENGDSGRQNMRLHPVTISRQDAQRSLKMALAGMSLAKKRLFPLLRSLRLKIRGFRLSYLPFSRSGNELVQLEASVAVNRHSIRSWTQ